MKFSHISILISLVILALGSNQSSIMSEPPYVEGVCTTYKLHVIDAASRDDIAKFANDFMIGKDIRFISFAVWETNESMYIGYCEDGINTCEDRVEPVAVVGHKELMDRVNRQTAGKEVVDILTAVGYQHTYTYIWFCETKTQKVTPQPTQPKEEPQITKPGKIMTSDPIKVESGEMIGIQTEINSTMPEKRSFTYIVQIKNESGSVVYLSWVENIGVLPGDFVKPSIFWLPENEGKYQAEVFLWHSIETPVPLAPVKSVSFEVG